MPWSTEPVRRLTKALIRAQRGIMHLLVVAALGAMVPGSHALSTTEGISLRTLEQFRAGGVPDDQWPMLLEALGREDQSTSIHAFVRELRPFPSAKLIELLVHPKLAVRSGALDLLEEAAGETFGFDPFLDDPSAGANAGALERWKAWTGAAEQKPPARSLTDEQFRTIALEIISGNRERSERAMQRLDRFGFAAIGQLENFLAQQSTLEPASRAALKAAEYRLVLEQIAPKSAAALARDLCFGNSEAQSIALTLLGKTGPGALPILADYFQAPDPLIRETAIDAAFEAGKHRAADLVAAHLPNEKVESVLHAIFRGLGDHPSAAAKSGPIVPFVKHNSENVIVSALEALGAETGDDVSEILQSALADPRWRVRSAATEAVAKRKLIPLTEELKKLLHDGDLFVRVSAVDALQALHEGPEPALLEAFKLQNELKAPILRVLLNHGDSAPQILFDQLWDAPPEIILQCLETLEDRFDHEGKRIVFAAPFAKHPNRDVSASALRLLASHGHQTQLLLEALKSTDSALVDAVLDALILPPDALARSADTPTTQSEEATNALSVINRLYTSLGALAEKQPTSAKAVAKPAIWNGNAPVAKGPSAPPDALAAVLKKLLAEGSPRQRFRAAHVLSSQGDLAATQFLLSGYDTFNDLDRRSLGAPLAGQNSWPKGPILDLVQRLLRDPGGEVRESILQNGLKMNHCSELLSELSRAGSLIGPEDLYGYELDKVARNSSGRSVLIGWAQSVLEEPSSSDPNRILSIILCSKAPEQGERIKKYLSSANPWLRRAAYRALGLPAAVANLDALLKDESAMVRAVFPFLASPGAGGWQHWFDDVHSASDSDDEGRMFSVNQPSGAWSNPKAGGSHLEPAVESALEKLAKDPSEFVRFEAQFALLRLGCPIDPAEFSGLLAAQSEESMAKGRVGRFLSTQFKRLGKGYGILVPIAGEIDKRVETEMLRHFGLDNEKGFTSFSAFAELAAASGEDPRNEIAEAPVVSSQGAVRVLFFHKVGCRECQRVREMLDRHAPDFPRLLVEEHDIDDPREALLSETLSKRFGLKETEHLATPAVFTQAGALIREAVTFPDLGELLRNANALVPDPEWARMGAKEVTNAKAVFTERYQALNIGVIAMAGLLDGINPCAFATLIFLLSYLQVARRSPREILLIGSTFVLAVFLTYFAVGFGLAQILVKVSGFELAGKILNQVLAGLALLVAILSFRDARLAARGRLSEMAIQLPSALKSQIHSVIRKGARANQFIVAAFLIGVAISLLELACTGQVYLPTILYMLHTGHRSAVPQLALYNFAFILPLIVVFALVFFGLRSEALIRFQTERTALVKTLTGALFLLLSASLLFGHWWH